MATLKKRSLVVLVAILLVVVIVVSSFVYLNSQKARSDNVTSITIGVIPLELNSLIYIANNQNYFAGNGLNITFQNYGSGLAAMQGMLNSQVDIAFASEFVVAEEALANDSFYTFGSLAAYNIYNMVARSNEGISTISDLSGKTIGVAFGTIAQFFLGSFLALNNINLSSVNIVNVPNTQTANALENGTVDAAVTYQPIINQIEAVLGNNTLVWSAQASQLGYWDAVCKTSWATAHSDLIVKFLKSLIQAENFIAGHSNQATTIVATTLNYIALIWQMFGKTISFQLVLIKLKFRRCSMKPNGL